MTPELDIEKHYDSAQMEAPLYQRWLQSGCFKGHIDAQKAPYCIMIPPPNVTGILTLGHVLNNTLQDILCRRARQEGKAVMWLPGTDHAGLATQVKVEKALREEGLSKEGLGREGFLKRAALWRDQHGGIIIEQLKRLGVSCDWDRNVHTLDEGYSRAVLRAFVKLYKKGLIYRGQRMVNWCPVSQTALSDEEVFMKPLMRKLYTVRYPLVDQPGQYLEVATTRPETIMGDTAVAVHPDDQRYRHLIGQQIWRPLMRAPLPIIGEASIDPAFGTGVLKVTPSHDATDFQIGQRHGLPLLEVIDAQGRLNALAGPEFQGMDRFEAREAVVAKLKQLGLWVKEEAYESAVGFSERGNVPIEPRVSEQWFLRYPRVEEAKRVIQQGLIRFHPARWTKVYLNWMENIQDWCISRQIWWGHRIPVWYRKGEDRNREANRYVGEEPPADAQNWEQDPDTLDTWASAWLWPFATLGWPEPSPEQQADLDFWYPTTDLVTGPDILFFWVARMIMAGLEFRSPEKEAPLTDEALARAIPFQNVYFTGIIRDSLGRKMSKSLGNSPDPIDLMDQYGADGLRFGIISCAPEGQDILYSEERVAQGRHFCNKLWNAARLRQLSGPLHPSEDLSSLLARIEIARLNTADYGILARLMECQTQLAADFKAYHFQGALQGLYSFFWNDYCDFYLETCKARGAEERNHVLAIQDLCLRQLLLMLHPFIPFITDALWGRLQFGQKGQFIQSVPLGGAEELQQSLVAHGIEVSSQAVVDMMNLRDLASQARTLKANYRMGHKRNLSFCYTIPDGQTQAAPLLESNRAILCFLIGAEKWQQVSVPPTGLPTVVTPLCTLYLDLTGHVDVGAERGRLQAEALELEKLVAAVQARLESPDFLNKAPAKVIEGARLQLETNQRKWAEVQAVLKGLHQE